MSTNQPHRQGSSVAGPSVLRSSDWIESYITALQSTGLSTEHVPDEDSTPSSRISKHIKTHDEQSATAMSQDDSATDIRVARFYVGESLKLAANDDTALQHAWRKAQVSGDLRLAHTAWRLWFIRMRNATRAKPDRRATDNEENASESEDESGPTPPTSSNDYDVESSSATESHDDVPPVPGDSPAGLYIVLISVHGLIRGQNMELGKDPDTGGQVKYVVEYARALAAQTSVHRVDLLTRRNTSSDVDNAYGEREERLGQPGDGTHAGGHGGAYIIRLDAGPTDQYLAKEKLWPYVHEFADRAVEHVRNSLERLASRDRTCRLHLVHGHYAEGGEVAMRIGAVLDSPVAFTGHSLGRNKLCHLKESKRVTDAEIEQKYRMRRRIEAEERALDAAEVVVTSTQQEVDGQWGLYDGWDSKLADALMRRRGSTGKFFPRMHVNPPGLDFAAGTNEVSAQDAEGVKPPVWNAIERFLRNPRKPAILAIARPEAKKNLATLVRAFGQSRALRDVANLVLVMGNRDAMGELAEGSQEVLREVLVLIDDYDLYGEVSIPKHHNQDSIPEIYKFCSSTKGVFVNPALQEPFGLTIIEACAYGVPVVATKNGGPVEIHKNLNNGLLVEPTDPDEVGSALISLLTDRATWEASKQNGLNNIHKYSWSAHCQRHLATLAEAAGMKTRQSHGEGKVSSDTSQLGERHSQSSAGGGGFALGARTASGPPSVGQQKQEKQEQRQSWSGRGRRESRVSTEGFIPSRHTIHTKHNKLMAMCIDTINMDEAAEGLKKAMEVCEEREEGREKKTAFGVLAIESYSVTREVLQRNNVDLEELVFMGVNNGADVYINKQEGEGMEMSDEWSSFVDFRWDKQVVEKAVAKAGERGVKVKPDQGKGNEANRSIEVGELLGKAQKEEGSNKTASGRLQRRRDNKGSQLVFEFKTEKQGEEKAQKAKEAVELVASVKASLRRKGVRCTLLRSNLDGALRATPLRATRALALRFVTGKIGVEFEERGVLCISCPFTGEEDRGDILGGAHSKAVLGVEDESEAILTEHGKATYTDYSRVSQARSLADLAGSVQKFIDGE